MSASLVGSEMCIRDSDAALAVAAKQSARPCCRMASTIRRKLEAARSFSVAKRKVKTAQARNLA
eukprot:14657262-Alexandrium_andersonii.AAC.1